MEPYELRNLTIEKAIFNYGLCQNRRIVKNRIGILANDFRIFLSPISVASKNAVKIVLESRVLHNYLRTELPKLYTHLELFDIKSTETGQLRLGDWRNDNNIFQQLAQQRGNRDSNNAIKV